MRINPDISTSAISRYDRVVHQDRARQQPADPKDKIEISKRAQLYTKLLKEARESEEISETRIHAVMNRIASGSYQVDLDKLADRMLGRD